MRKILTRSILATLTALAVAPAAMSADDWTGGYIGLYAGAFDDPDDGDRIDFDTNLDGTFGDVIRNAAGADAFSPGFCDGIAEDRTPGAGCKDNSGGADWGFRAGYDWDLDNFVLGIIFEYGQTDVRDAVSAFSITPARYTMLRKVDDLLALRGRIGMTFGDGNNLIYGTAGYVRANIDNFFLTSNAVNTFVSSGDDEADGYQVGIGYERRFWDNVTLGFEYMYTALDDDEARVRVQGPAPAGNPFLIVNPAGTDFARSDDDLDLDSFRVTATYRF